MKAAHQIAANGFVFPGGLQNARLNALELVRAVTGANPLRKHADGLIIAQRYGDGRSAQRDNRAQQKPQAGALVAVQFPPQGAGIDLQRKPLFPAQQREIRFPQAGYLGQARQNLPLLNGKKHAHIRRQGGIAQGKGHKNQNPLAFALHGRARGAQTLFIESLAVFGLDVQGGQLFPAAFGGAAKDLLVLPVYEVVLKWIG